MQFSDIADAFISKYISEGGFLALHWRYDKNDWYVHCTRDGQDIQSMRDNAPCKLVSKYVPISTT